MFHVFTFFFISLLPRSEVGSEEPGDWRDTGGTTVSQLMSRLSADIITQISVVSAPLLSLSDQRAGERW